MDEIGHFSLRQLQELLNGYEQDGTRSEAENEALVGNYISQNLAIAREMRPQIVFSQLKGSPMLMPEMRILIIRQGWVEPTVNLTPRHYEAGTLVFVGPDSVVQFERASDDLAGYGLSMSSDLFSLAVGQQVPKAFDGHLRDFSLQLTPEDADFLDRLHHLLYLNTRQQEHSSQVTLHLISSLLWFVSQRWSQHEEAAQRKMTREQRLFSDFIQLVNRDVRQQHQVEYYASKLCMAPRYFSTVIRGVSGKPPKEWIDDALLTQIKIELKYSEKTVVQISDDNNFPNPSFFSKFFKRLAGMTPLEYKQKE